MAKPKADTSSAQTTIVAAQGDALVVERLRMHLVYLGLTVSGSTG